MISHGGAGGFDQEMITAHLHLHKMHRIISVSRFGHLRTPLNENSSAVTQAENIAGKIPDAELLSLPDGGHLKLKHFDKIKNRVSNFIDSVH